MSGGVGGSVVGLRTGTALVAAARAATGGALLLIGLVLGLSGRVGDFGVLVRAVAIAHLAVQFTDRGGLAAFTARSADPLSDELRRACRDWLTRSVVARTVLVAPVVIAATWFFDVPPVVGVAVFGALSLQRLAAELLRSDGRVVAYAVTGGLASSGLWLVAVAIVVAVGVEPTAIVVALLHAAANAVVGSLGLVTARGAGGVGDLLIDDPRPPEVLAGRRPLFLEGLLEAAVRNADVVLVSVVVGREEAGLYAVASRLVAVAMTPLAAANGALAREYGERWARGGSAALSALARRVARRITGFPAAMTIGAGAVALWRPDDGGAGTVALVTTILLGAATVSTAAGSAGLLLGICRREVASARISAAAIATSVVLLLLLGGIGGLVPAALGFAVGVAAQNIGQAWYLRRSLGVVSHA